MCSRPQWIHACGLSSMHTAYAAAQCVSLRATLLLSRELATPCPEFAHLGSAVQGWKLIVTGHSLGAGCAALLTLALKDRFPSEPPCA